MQFAGGERIHKSFAFLRMTKVADD